MAMKRSQPKSPAVRKSSCVGPDYEEIRYRNPVGDGVHGDFGSHDEKAIFSEAGSTFDGGGAPLAKGKYNPLWEGK